MSGQPSAKSRARRNSGPATAEKPQENLAKERIAAYVPTLCARGGFSGFLPHPLL